MINNYWRPEPGLQEQFSKSRKQRNWKSSCQESRANVSCQDDWENNVPSRDGQPAALLAAEWDEDKGSSIRFHSMEIPENREDWSSRFSGATRLKAGVHWEERETALKYHFTCSQLGEIKQTQTPGTMEAARKQECSHTLGYFVN